MTGFMNKMKSYLEVICLMVAILTATSGILWYMIDSKTNPILLEIKHISSMIEIIRTDQTGMKTSNDLLVEWRRQSDVNYAILSKRVDFLENKRAELKKDYSIKETCLEYNTKYKG